MDNIIDPSLQENLAKQQIELSKKVIIPTPEHSFIPKDGNIFFALDIQYKNDIAHIAADIWQWPKQRIATYTAETHVNVPYVPSYFCFREGPPLLALIEKIIQDKQIIPDFLVIDGHGIAHPRRFGVACWLGVTLEIPTIGCAKDTLIHYDSMPEKQRGKKEKIYLNEEVVGYVLITQDNTRAIFVSPGHLVAVDTSAEIALLLPGEYRISDPIRHADHAAREHAKGICDGTWQDLGKIG